MSNNVKIKRICAWCGKEFIAHPHCHIIFNRMDNGGKTISDKNDFRRNGKVCKMLTTKYRLHFATGKDHIKEERLRHYDKTKHEIYKALKEELPKVHNWNKVKDALGNRDIDMKFKVSQTTREILEFSKQENKYPNEDAQQEFLNSISIQTLLLVCEMVIFL